jgi:hypothetical protein
MRYFYVEPEVAGSFGEDAIVDRSVHPPVVSYLQYEMDGWLGDALLEKFPIFIVTEEAKRNLLKSGVTGADFATADVTTSEQFRELYPDRDVPPFVWLKPNGKAGQDDFGIAPDGRLVASDRALDVLRKFGIENALIEPFDGESQ